MLTKEEWRQLYQLTKNKYKDILRQYDRQSKLYIGRAVNAVKKDGSESGIKYNTIRNLAFEMTETQIVNDVPAPKVTPRDNEKVQQALQVEGYLKNEMDRLDSERLNDESERSTYIHGTTFYHVDWDERQTTPTTRGELVIAHYPLNRLFPQFGISDFKKVDYLFTIDYLSIDKVKEEYNIKENITPYSDTNDVMELVTVWFYDKDHDVCRYGFDYNNGIDIFYNEKYYTRRAYVCKDCGEDILEEEACPVCGSTKFKWVTREKETLTEDIIKGNPKDPENSITIAKQGEKIDYYKIKQLPFVIRKNISKESSLLGISDVDMLDHIQDTMNKVTNKITENITKGGAIITMPNTVSYKMNNDTLKVVKLKDYRQAEGIKVHNLEAGSTQQDLLMATQLYNDGRNTVGITDSYQGKRDPTAESGKAKEIAAAQSSGRLESKRRMKDAAFQDLYELMFKFLLAFCDEKRTYSRTSTTGEYIEGKFSRYNYLDGEPGKVYYNDRFLFSVDNASILSTNREAMWRETTSNYQAGTFGDPTQTSTRLMYWTMMDKLGYPLSKAAIQGINESSQQLPDELQQAIIQNPEILQTVQQVLKEGNKNG